MPTTAKIENILKPSVPGCITSNTPKKPKMIALHLRQPTFSFKKITAPKTTTSGVACNIAEAFVMGIKAIAIA